MYQTAPQFLLFKFLSDTQRKEAQGTTPTHSKTLGDLNKQEDDDKQEDLNRSTESEASTIRGKAVSNTSSDNNTEDYQSIEQQDHAVVTTGTDLPNDHSEDEVDVERPVYMTDIEGIENRHELLIKAIDAAKPTPKKTVGREKVLDL